MKRSLQLLTLVCIILFTAVILNAEDKGKSSDNPLRKSDLEDPTGVSTFPTPFNKSSNQVTSPPVSTGYYFVDSDDGAPLAWRPINAIEDTNVERDYWRRILPGPRVRDSIYWYQNNTEGLRFFRNPALPAGNRSMFSHGVDNATDSTDNAFAGPIPIKFEFYFNGIRFDSFYVSTNGVIALTNRRYFYDNNGNRYVPDGETSCYDPMSMDWFLRSRTGDGLTDATPDNFGYQFAVCGNAPNTATAGIRKNSGSITKPTFPDNQRAALIAPFFGELMLSQYNPKIYQPDDFGQVWYKRTPDNNKLIIYIKNAAIVNTMKTRYGNFPVNSLDLGFTYDLRPGDPNFVAASAQVVLDRSDSSITINYDKFEGQIAFAPDTVVSAQQLFLYNTAVGVRGFARHVNYGQSSAPSYPWHSEYEQYTLYFSNLEDSLNTIYPKSNLSIKFKQWQNTLRVTSISFRTRNSNANADLCYTQTINAATAWEYELLAGHQRLGQLQPVAIIQNLTNDIQGPQGVNYQVQQLKFKARFKIINEVTRRTVYDRMVLIDSLTLATPLLPEQDCNGEPNAQYCSATGSTLPFPGAAPGLNGIPPYGYVKVTFPPFDPDPNQANHVGRMRGFCIAEPVNALTDEGLGDAWPFDDTISVRFFVMKRLTDFGDDVSHYHLVFDVETNRWTTVPNALKWVSVGCEVVDGDTVSYMPLPPQGQFRPTNFVDYNITDPDFSIDTVLNSPTIMMNRITLAGNEPAGNVGGDELRSFPIDMRGKKNSVLSLSIQRAKKQKDWPRGWADQRLIGPEMRTVVNASPYDIWDEYSANTSRGGSVAINFDVIDVEFARSSPDGIQYVTNIAKANWRYHPGINKLVTNMPAYELFGGGGYMRGFAESNKDSSLDRPNLTGGVANGLRFDIYDDGIDFEYKRVFIPIPDTFITISDDAAMNFRFRINVEATNHQKKINCPSCIPDDDDPFFVDNVRILHPLQYTDLGLSKVDIEWPYTVVPISQTGAIPVRVKVNNNTSIAAPTFLIKTKIFKQGDEHDSTKAIYCRTEQLPFLSASSDIEIYMPNWNAKSVQTDTTETYIIVANIIMLKPDGTKGDLVASNDTCRFKFTLRTSDVFAFDPVDNPVNDVPHPQFSNIVGRGLNLFGYSYGGRGVVAEPRGTPPYYTEVPYGVGDTRGSGSGQIGVKFTLLQADTIKGYQALFANLNQAPDYIAFSTYKDQNGQPGDLVPNSYMLRERGMGDGQNGVMKFNQYITYYLENPVILDEGSYWVIISQLGQTGLELGASKSRMGLRTTSIYKPFPPTNETAVGASGYNMMVDKAFRKKNASGFMINENYFIYENSMGSGSWSQFMPTVGNPGYAHLHHYGITPIDGSTATLTRGTWIPMLRPYFGFRQYVSSYEYNPCSDDVIPVSLVYFDGQVRKQAIELYWETTSEINNSGFQVEKNVCKENQTEDWKQIGFVKGAGTSNNTNRYSFIDQDVAANTTYQYRLRQVDKDGIISCENYSKVVTLHFDNIEGVVLEQNQPNPFSVDTKINFRIPEQSRVILEIVDIYGNNVKTIVNTELAPNRYEYIWDGYNSNGEIVSTGTYIYRLKVGDEIYTGKMSFIR